MRLAELKLNTIRRVLQKGFSLIELLIVVIILAILAAIVVPQFAASTEDAGVSSLDTTLVNMRTVIDLYHQQHGDYPGKNTAVAPTCSSTAGTGKGAITDSVTFFDQMTMYTTKRGRACSTADKNFRYGPYLKRRNLQANPITADGTVAMVSTGDLIMVGANPDCRHSKESRDATRGHVSPAASRRASARTDQYPGRPTTRGCVLP